LQILMILFFAFIPLS